MTSSNLGDLFPSMKSNVGKSTKMLVGTYISIGDGGGCSEFFRGWQWCTVARVRVRFYPYCSAEKLICDNLFHVGSWV